MRRTPDTDSILIQQQRRRPQAKRISIYSELQHSPNPIMASGPHRGVRAFDGPPPSYDSIDRIAPPPVGVHEMTFPLALSRQLQYYSPMSSRRWCGPITASPNRPPGQEAARFARGQEHIRGRVPTTQRRGFLRAPLSILQAGVPSDIINRRR